MALTRRQLLVGAGAGGALVVGWALTPRDYPAPLQPGPGEVALDAWLMVGRDGRLTVAVPQLEMGQGITTLLPQIVAMEMDADWTHVAAQPAPVSEIWANTALAARWAPLWMPAFPEIAQAPDSWLTRQWAQRHRFMATADGQSLAAYEMPARQAAATARALLVEAAARRWGVAARDCVVQAGFVIEGQRRLGFGELAQEAARLRLSAPPPLRAQPPRELPGDAPTASASAFPRLDLPEKALGAAPFAGDIRLEGQLYAAIRQAPIGEASLAHYEEAPARAVPGFARLVAGEDWLAAVATNGWAAEQALAAAGLRFAVQGAAESAHVEAALAQALAKGTPVPLWQTGDPEGIMAGRPSLTARYDVAPALPVPLETATATAHWRREGWTHRLDLWVATQAPEQTRLAVARALGLPTRHVLLYPVPAGGSFDARLETPHAVQAALIARAVERPVQLAYTRWQEQIGSLARPPMAARLAAKVDPAGGLLAWQMHVATPSTMREFGERLLGGRSRSAAAARAGNHADALALEGAAPPYAVPHLGIAQVPTAIGLPTGRVRGNAQACTAFFTESFIDELAVSLGREPLSLRMGMLGDDPRLAQCLQRVATLAGWNGGRDGSGAGLACHRIGSVAQGGCIAAIATARRAEEGTRVERIVAVVDIGRIVNLDIARQQIEGGLLYGLGLALGGSPGYAGGLPMATSLAQMGLPTLADCPQVLVDFVVSSATPADPGELGVAVAAPAIANALFSATGLRFRRLPLSAEE